MRKYKRYSLIIFFIGISLVLGIYATIIIFQENQLKVFHIINLIKNYEYILLIPFITIMNIILRFLRWNFVLRNFNIKIPTRELSIYYFLSFFGNLSPFYFLHIIRLVPLIKRKIYSGFFIFLFDILLDISSIIYLFIFENNFTKIIFIFILTIVCFIVYFINKISKKNLIINHLFSFLFLLFLSILIWYSSSLTLYFSMMTFYDRDLIFQKMTSFNSIVKIFSEMNLLNVFSMIPAGIYVSGSRGIELLINIGLGKDSSIYIIFLFRLFTIWIAVGIAIFAIIKFRRILISKDKHFNAIADEYKEQIPSHIRERLLEKKIHINKKYLPLSHYQYGLDAGCGQGWYLKEMIKNHYKVKGIDESEKQVEYAKSYCGINDIYVGTITNLPFKKDEFDFIYTINVLHHLNSKEEQILALKEFYRILRPKGRLIIHEINVRNPLFRFYMSYIFPLLHSIDEGTEIWLEPYKDKEMFYNFKIIGVEYFTFFPEFLPAFVLNILSPIEKKLEESIIKKYSAHYAMILEKP